MHRESSRRCTVSTSVFCVCIALLRIPVRTLLLLPYVDICFVDPYRIRSKWGTGPADRNIKVSLHPYSAKLIWKRIPLASSGLNTDIKWPWDNAPRKPAFTTVLGVSDPMRKIQNASLACPGSHSFGLFTLIPHSSTPSASSLDGIPPEGRWLSGTSTD